MTIPFSMTSKERMQAALSGGRVDRLPVAPVYLDLFLAGEVRQKALQAYLEWMGEVEEMPLDPTIEAHIQAQSILQAWSEFQPAPDWLFWMPLLPPSNWLRECVLRREGQSLWRVHVPDGQRHELSKITNVSEEIQDRWGQTFPADPGEVDSLVPLTSAGQIIHTGQLAAVQQLVAAVGERVFICGGLGTPFWDCYFKLGFQGIMEMPIQEPEIFQYLLERQHLALLELCRAYAQAGVSGIFIEECMTSADLISPRFYERFVFPSTQRFLDEVSALGPQIIFYYCGDVTPRYPRLAELPVQALAVEESKKGFHIDLGELAKVVGKRKVIFGNIDATQIAGWSDAEMEQELQNQQTAARPAKGFIPSMGSPFPLDTPRERTAAFIRLAQSLALQGD